MLHLKNGTLLTMGDAGVIERGDLLIDQGKIVAVGQNLCAENAEVVDLAGKYVLPGLVDAHAHRGGISMDGSFGDDLNELTTPVTPELNAYYAIDPDDASFREALSFGITSSCIAPGSGNVICGYAVVVKSAGDTLSSRVIRNPAALKAAVGINPKSVYAKKNANPMTRMGIAQTMRKYLTDVREYMEKKENPDEKKRPPYDEGLEHGIPVLKKEIPLKVHSYQHDMLTVLRIAEEFDIFVTLDHALGASDFAEELSASPHLAGVIYGPITGGLFPGEGCKIDYHAMKMLDDRGVCTAMMTDSPVIYSQMLINQVGECVRAGMDPLRALRMITINAAKIIGCDRRIGSLEVGKDADIAVYSQQPALAPQAKCLMTFVDGRLVYDAKGAHI